MQKYQVGGKFLFNSNPKAGYIITGIKPNSYDLKPIDPNQFKNPKDCLNSISYVTVGWLMADIWYYQEPEIKKTESTLFSFDDL